jgi:hypothetical protein
MDYVVNHVGALSEIGFVAKDQSWHQNRDACLFDNVIWNVILNSAWDAVCGYDLLHTGRVAGDGCDLGALAKNCKEDAASGRIEVLHKLT